MTDNVFSPRVGIVYKPVEPLSLYVSYSSTFQPRAGEQLASLTLTNAALKPEQFTNYEVGAKWDVLPSLSMTAALFTLDRTNLRRRRSSQPSKADPYRRHPDPPALNSASVAASPRRGA